MACEITFGDRSVQLNNMQFAGLIDFAIEVAERTAPREEHYHIEHMKRLRAETFWPGRGIEIEIDFPTVEQRKFWARVFLDTARMIFERLLGTHEYLFWQAQRMHQAYSTGLLFEFAVDSVHNKWRADTIDRREFDTWAKEGYRKRSERWSRRHGGV